MSIHKCAKFLALLLTLSSLFQTATARGDAPSIPVIHLINDSGHDIFYTLTTTTPFVTDFKGANDVTVTELTGGLGANYQDTFGGAFGPGNPFYITNFVGSATNGTGNSQIGTIEDIQTSVGLVLQFDFARQFTPNDCLFVIDCDNSEEYEIKAYVKNGTNYNVASLTNWQVVNYSGSTAGVPTGAFPEWFPNTTNGYLVGSSQALNEPLTVLRPDQSIDRVIITEISGNGTATVQFVHPVLGTLGISVVGTNAVITVPTNDVTPSLQASSNLAQAVWTTVTNSAPGGTITVPLSTNAQQFFRLQY